VSIWDPRRRPPVVEVNRAIAIGFGNGPAAGLDALAPLHADPVLAV
jgi:RNA polymerase sigma-70 factor (ECF subfamily)